MLTDIVTASHHARIVTSVMDLLCICYTRGMTDIGVMRVKRPKALPLRGKCGIFATNFTNGRRCESQMGDAIRSLGMCNV